MRAGLMGQPHQRDSATTVNGVIYSNIDPNQMNPAVPSVETGTAEIDKFHEPGLLRQINDASADRRILPPDPCGGGTYDADCSLHREQPYPRPYHRPEYWHCQPGGYSARRAANRCSDGWDLNPPRSGRAG